MTVGLILTITTLTTLTTRHLPCIMAGGSVMGLVTASRCTIPVTTVWAIARSVPASAWALDLVIPTWHGIATLSGTAGIILISITPIMAAASWQLVSLVRRSTTICGRLTRPVTKAALPTMV